MREVRLHRNSWRAGAGAAALLVLATACATPTPLSPTASAATTAPAGDLSASDIALAVQVRTKYGLRTDEAWIRFVASDLSASTLEGVPLAKTEEGAVARLIAPSEATGTTVRTYARSKPDYAGTTIDWDRGGIVVAYFAGDAAPHRAALEAILPPNARFEVVQVQYTWEELLALSRLVDAGWLQSIGARFVSSGVDMSHNQVRVEVSTGNPTAAQQIIDHYNAHGRMYVKSQPAP